MTPMRAIRAKCIDCCCGQRAEVRQCTAQRCPLWPYRMGHRPTPADPGGLPTAREDPGVAHDSQAPRAASTVRPQEGRR